MPQDLPPVGGYEPVQYKVCSLLSSIPHLQCPSPATSNHVVMVKLRCKTMKGKAEGCEERENFCADWCGIIEESSRAGLQASRHAGGHGGLDDIWILQGWSWNSGT